MLFRLPFLSLVLQPNIAFALPRSNNSNTPSGIQAVIKDHNGMDITSSFKIRAYEDKPASSNTTIHDRQIISARPINNCHVADGFFRSSLCVPVAMDGVTYTMQTWRIFCHVPHDIRHPGTGETRTVWVGASHLGDCEDHETCVDSLDFNAYNQLTHVARCVSQEDYVFVNNTDHKNLYLEDRFTGKRVGVMLSESDGTTPLEVEELAVQPGTGKNLDQSKTCQDCVGLHTDTLLPDTTSLKTEVKLLTTGAVTGILWLAFMSG